MRRKGRECALQILYQLDVGRLLDVVDAAGVDAAVQRYWNSFEPVSPDVRDFAERLVQGVVAALSDVDAAIGEVSHHWRLGRMSAVDRSLLRLAAYEILRCPDIPRAASINEAIEIAKRFGGPESASFINGILDKLGASES